MHKVINKLQIARGIYLLEVDAPVIANTAKPGQFVIIRTNTHAERIPLTIYDFDKDKKTVSLIFQVVGRSTMELASLDKGDIILDVVGPLGSPFSEDAIKKRVVIIGGGVGTAAVYPKLKALRKNSAYIISIIGARSKEYLILEEKIKELSDMCFITTDDGSYGRRGLVSDVLSELLIDFKVEIVVVAGPVLMMKKIAEITEKYKDNLKLYVSLNPIMVDGTGMCGSCRVTIAEKTRFACVDGPSFNGHEVDYDELLYRNQRFLKEEKIAISYLEKKE